MFKINYYLCDSSARHIYVAVINIMYKCHYRYIIPRREWWSRRITCLDGIRCGTDKKERYSGHSLACG